MTISKVASNRWRKYFRPTSLTFWAAVYPFVCGVFIASEPLHGCTSWALTVSNSFDNASAMVLINAGLAGVGLRGALA